MTRGPSLEYLVLRCSDLERSRTFYEALGLQLTHEQHGRGTPHYSCNLGETVLEPYPLSGRPSSGARLGLRVASVRATVEAMARIGADVRVAPDGASAVIRDPDSHEIAIVEDD
jgi:lactoylglutathione lyase